jgi:hypothetical protein
MHLRLEVLLNTENCHLIQFTHITSMLFKDVPISLSLQFQKYFFISLLFSNIKNGTNQIQYFQSILCPVDTLCSFTRPITQTGAVGYADYVCVSPVCLDVFFELLIY